MREFTNTYFIVSYIAYSKQADNVFQGQPETIAENYPTTEPGTEIFNVFNEENHWSEDEEEFEVKFKNLKFEEDLQPQVQDTELIKHEMVKIYGDQGAKDVLAMETQMQLKFERMTDKYSAELWPCLPLNMKFDK